MNGFALAAVLYTLVDDLFVVQRVELSADNERIAFVIRKDLDDRFDADVDVLRSRLTAFGAGYRHDPELGAVPGMTSRDRIAQWVGGYIVTVREW